MNRTKEEVLNTIADIDEYELQEVPIEHISISYETALQAMEEYAKECMPKWISVENALPDPYREHVEISNRVLLCFESGTMVVGFYHHTYRKWLMEGDGSDVTVFVTHWMPLPQSPTE